MRGTACQLVYLPVWTNLPLDLPTRLYPAGATRLHPIGKMVPNLSKSTKARNWGGEVGFEPTTSSVSIRHRVFDANYRPVGNKVFPLDTGLAWLKEALNPRLRTTC
jgi:hypothetical protein